MSARLVGSEPSFCVPSLTPSVGEVGPAGVGALGVGKSLLRPREGALSARLVGSESSFCVPSPAKRGRWPGARRVPGRRGLLPAGGVDLITASLLARDYLSSDYEAGAICGKMDDMDESEDYQLPPGRQPYDVLNGLRIGALAGGIVGAIVLVVTSLESLWVLLVGAAIGAVVGYVYERRKLNAARDSSQQS